MATSTDGMNRVHSSPIGGRCGVGYRVMRAHLQAARNRWRWSDATLLQCTYTATSTERPRAPESAFAPRPRPAGRSVADHLDRPPTPWPRCSPAGSRRSR